MSKELTQTSTGLSQNLTFDRAFQQAEYLIDKKLVPASIRTPEQLVAIIKMGESLNMNAMAALNSIDIIQGQLAVKSKAIAGLLTANNIVIEVIKDLEPIIERKPSVIMVEKDGKNVPDIDEEGRIKYYRDPNGEIIYKEKEVDKITTLRFKKFVPNIGVSETDISFLWSEAVKAGWVSKPNWIAMPRYMAMARCLAKGARIVASHLICGLYTDYEVAEFTETDFDVNEDGDLIIKK